MKPSPVNLAANLFKRSKIPGFNEICTLINLDDEPAALIDSETESILFINSRLVKYAVLLPATWGKNLPSCSFHN